MPYDKNCYDSLCFCFLFAVGVLSGLDPTVIPIIRSIFSKLVSQDDQGNRLCLPRLTCRLHYSMSFFFSGSLFAVVTGVQVLSAAFASVLYNTVFRQILEKHLHPGLAFILMGIIGLLPIPLML